MFVGHFKSISVYDRKEARCKRWSFVNI